MHGWLMSMYSAASSEQASNVLDMDAGMLPTSLIRFQRDQW